MRLTAPSRDSYRRGDRDSQSVRKVLTFQVADQRYGISIERVQEILPLPLLARTPGLPPLVAGFIHLDRKAIPVIKLARLFGMPEQSPGRYTPLLLLNFGTAHLALLVDSVERVVRVDDDAIVPLADGICFNSCVIGLVTSGDAGFVLLADDRLLSQQEHHRLDDLVAIEQSRLEELRGDLP